MSSQNTSLLSTAKFSDIIVTTPNDSENNKTLIADLVDRAINQKQLDALEEYLAEDVVHHTFGSVDGVGMESYKKIIEGLITAFPDLEVTIEADYAKEDKVALRLTYRGTHLGDYIGIPPTGKEIVFTGSCIDRINDGKVVEEWMEYDALAVMLQIGAMESIQGMSFTERTGDDFLWSNDSSVLGALVDSETAKDIVTQNTLEVTNNKNIDFIDEIYSPLFVNHDPLNPTITGELASFKEWYQQTDDKQDGAEVIEDILCEGDTVISRWRYTWKEPEFGNQIFYLSGHDFWRLADGVIVERWSSKDYLTMLNQYPKTSYVSIWPLYD